MAFVQAENFFNYQTAQLSKVFAVVGSGVSVGHTSGRFGLGGLTFAFPGAFGNQVTTINMPGHATTLIQAALKQDALQVSGAWGGKWLSLMDSNTQQISIFIEQTGQLAVYRSTAAGTGHSSQSLTLLGRTAGAVVDGVLRYFEIKVVSHASTGVVLIKRDGTTVLNLTSQNTAISGTANVAAIVMGGYERTSADDDYVLCTMSDLLVMDGSGSSFNDLQGDVGVEIISPTGAGNYAQFTPSASTNVSNIDDAYNGIDDDTTYNATAAGSANKDSFVHSDLTAPSGGAILAVVVSAYARKTDGGSNQLKPFARLSATDATGTGKELTGTYGFIQLPMETKPGGGAWTVADVNNAEFGYSS